MKSTRIIYANAPSAAKSICKQMKFLRAEMWRRYGALGNVGKASTKICTEITKQSFYRHLFADSVIKAAVARDTANDILMYKAAAKTKVRKAIYARTEDEDERKRLFTLLKSDKWIQDNFLHRQMRKHFRHGISHVGNQFIVRSDRHTEQIVNGRLVITIRIAKKYGKDIKLVATTNGKNVDLSHRNLRVIIKEDVAEIHFCAEKEAGRPSGEQTIGVDKGYTEAFVDSDGDVYGVGFGRVLTEYSDQTAKTGIARGKLYSLEKKHRELGHIKKANHILVCNLGKKKLNMRRMQAKKRIRDIAFKAAHSIVDKAALVASEDLTSSIASKVKWRKFNRRMGTWAKGVLAEALDSVCRQRGIRHQLVSSAYTSQMDSVTGLLKGKRVGDKFYRENGDVIQADHNAARNVLARLSDKDITRYMPFWEVKRILLARSSGGTGRQLA